MPEMRCVKQGRWPLDWMSMGDAQVRWTTNRHSFWNNPIYYILWRCQTLMNENVTHLKQSDIYYGVAKVRWTTNHSSQYHFWTIQYYQPKMLGLWRCQYNQNETKDYLIQSGKRQTVCKVDDDSISIVLTLPCYISWCYRDTFLQLDEVLCLQVSIFASLSFPVFYLELHVDTIRPPSPVCEFLVTRVGFRCIGCWLWYAFEYRCC